MNIMEQNLSRCFQFLTASFKKMNVAQKKKKGTGNLTQVSNEEIAVVWIHMYRAEKSFSVLQMLSSNKIHNLSQLTTFCDQNNEQILCDSLRNNSLIPT